MNFNRYGLGRRISLLTDKLRYVKMNVFPCSFPQFLRSDFPFAGKVLAQVFLSSSTFLLLAFFVQVKIANLALGQNSSEYYRGRLNIYLSLD